MSTARDGRNSASAHQHRRSPFQIPSLSRPSSSQTAQNNMDAKYDFLLYKNENRTIQELIKFPAVSTSNRDERRKSKANADDSSKKKDDSAAILAQANVDIDSDNQELTLPLKIFDGTKKAISDVSEQSRSYFWMRRIKEIILQMGTTNEPFVEFDMSIAKADMIATCDVYLQNDYSKLKKKGGSGSDDADERGLIQKIEESVKQLRNAEALLADKTASADVVVSLRQSTKQVMSNIQLLTNQVNDVIGHLTKEDHSKDNIDVIRKALRALPKEGKSQLKIQQEWDMKKLYAEVFKISYTRNELQTFAQRAELKPAKKGNEEPNFRNAIWWYSCNEASIYHQINSMLKLENFELLMSYRYYLSDLCKMIECICNNDQSQSTKVSTFYRAASISLDRLTAMKKSLEEKKKGQLISMGGFTSTTSNLDIAKRYARTQSLSSGNVRVLFKISVKSDTPCAAFAYIGQISFHPEEEETLFSMSSTFSVDKIDDPGSSNNDSVAERVKSANAAKEEVNYYTVHVTACDVDKALLDDIRAKVQECSASQLSVLLAQYMLELGEYCAARKYLTSLCSESTGILKDDPALPGVYNCLGMTFYRQNLYADAIEHYKKAMDSQARIGYSNNNALAEIHNNIGLAYIGLKLMAEAQAMFEEAERIQLREPSSTRIHLAAIYANIGYVHYSKKGADRDLDGSEEYFKKAVRIYQKATTKISHDAIERALLKAECYSNYGHLLSAKKASDAQERYNEALKIYKNVLPEGDPKLMRAYMNIMMEHAHNHNYKEVIDLYEDETLSALIKKQAANLFALDKIVTQDDLVVLIQMVGACYIQHEKQFFKAIGAWIEEYKLKRKSKLVQLLFPSDSTILPWLRKLIDISYNKAYAYFMSDQVEMPKDNAANPDKARAPSGRSKSAKVTQPACPTINFSRGFMCYKKSLYKDAINYFQKALKENDDLHSNLLLVDMYEATHKLDKAMEVYEQSLKKIQPMKDQPTFIEVSIAQMKCYGDYTKAIEQLKQLRKNLNINDTDTIRISLQAIVYDTLAEYHLKQKEYSDAIAIATKNSIPLKMRSLSQYHPSLAKNHRLVAEAFIDREKYANAIKSLEHTIEIQRLNLSNEHLDIKLVYYRMGDVYCMMNQLEQAREKYDFAESDISEDNDDNNVNAENQYDSRRLLARVHMNQNLASVYARRAGLDTAEPTAREEDWILAIEKSSASIEILKELYPFDAPIQSLDILTFVNRLKRLETYNERLANAMELDRSGMTEATYLKALSIQTKLLRYKEANTGDIYRKIGQYYERIQSDQETAIHYYEEAINQPLSPQAAVNTYYALGQLKKSRGEDSGTVVAFYNKAYDLIDKDDKILKTILRENCPEQQGGSNKTATDDAVEESNENPNDDDTTVYVDNTKAADQEPKDVPVYKKVEAYQRLDDLQSLMTYCEGLIEKYSEQDTTFDLEIPDYDDAQSDQRVYLQVLTEILCACAENVRPTQDVDDEKNIMLELADAHLHWAHALKINDEYNKAVEHYYKSFILNTKNDSITATAAASLKFIEKLKNSTISNSQTLVSEYVVDSPIDGTRLWLQLAAAYRQDGYEDEDSQDSTDKSIEACLKALENATEHAPRLRVACHYTMLRIYRDIRYANDDGKEFIEQMAKDGEYKNRQEHLTLFDQRLLSQWVRDFIKEYNERCDYKENEIPNSLANDFSLPSLTDVLTGDTDASKCLGDILMEIRDYQGAIAYWEWLIDECEILYTKSIKTLIYSDQRTINQVFDEIEQLQDNPDEHRLQFATSHKQLADYYMQACDRPGVFASHAVVCLENAKSQCQTALELRSKINREKKPDKTDLKQFLEEIEKKLDAARDKAKEEEEEEEDQENDSDDDNDYDYEDDDDDDSGSNQED